MICKEMQSFNPLRRIIVKQRKFSLPLAPHGEYLQSKILSGSKYEIAIIFMGDNAKDRAESLQPYLPYILYLPNRTSPYRYIWPVNQMETYLVDTSLAGGNFVKQCIMCLFEYGAKTIHYQSSLKRQTFKRN